MCCPDCLRGDHNLCPNGEDTIIGHHGADARFLRAPRHRGRHGDLPHVQSE
jgi:threonine dehydrogenase-like Zn-dependent dehydrogenase